MKSSLTSALDASGKAQVVDVERLADSVSQTGDVVATFVAPSGDAYRGYALIRQPRKVTDINVQKFLLSQGLSSNPDLTPAGGGR